MFNIRIDDAPYKTVKSLMQLCYEICMFIARKNSFFTIQVVDTFGHEVAFIDGDIVKKCNRR